MSIGMSAFHYQFVFAWFPVDAPAYSGELPESHILVPTRPSRHLDVVPPACSPYIASSVFAYATSIVNLMNYAPPRRLA